MNHRTYLQAIFFLFPGLVLDEDTELTPFFGEACKEARFDSSGNLPPWHCVAAID